MLAEDLNPTHNIARCQHQDLALSSLTTADWDGAFEGVAGFARDGATGPEGKFLSLVSALV